MASSEKIAKEEQGHLDYLNSRLDEWQKTGAITIAALDTAIPSRKSIDEGVAKLREKVKGKPSPKFGLELELLKKALDAEVETSNFYKEMVRTLDSDGQKLFDLHEALVLEDLVELHHQGIPHAPQDRAAEDEALVGLLQVDDHHQAIARVHALHALLGLDGMDAQVALGEVVDEPG